MDNKPLTSGQKSARTKKIREVTNDILDKLLSAEKDIIHYQEKIKEKAKVYGSTPSLVTLFSDWHFGHQVRDPETKKFLFNIEIATNRILSIPSKIKSICKNKKYNELVILLGGDMVCGEGIFQGQEWITEDHAVEQVSKLTQLIFKIIKDLKYLFPYIKIYTTKGNHGRTQGSPESNWDNMLYQMLSILIKMNGDKNIEIKNTYGDYATFEIKKWKGMIRHIAPVGAETPSGIAKYASWHMMHKWDFICMAHWHHWGLMTVCGKPIFRNGSLVGGDEYSEILAKHDDPVQLCWEVTDTEVCNNIQPIRFD